MGASKKMAEELLYEEKPVKREKTAEEVAGMIEEAGIAHVATAWDVLHDIDVTPNLLQKQGLSYLPWPVVYDTFNSLFGPEEWDCEELKDDRTGNNYFTDGKTSWVEVRIRVHNCTKYCSLPVMDNHNRSIALENMTSFDVNDALQRCKVKCAAYWGLGTDVFCKLAKIEITKQSEMDAQKAQRLNKAVSDLQQCTSLDILNVIMNNYRDLWNDDTFRAEGSAVKARLTNAA